MANKLLKKEKEHCIESFKFLPVVHVNDDDDASDDDGNNTNITTICLSISLDNNILYRLRKNT